MTEAFGFPAPVSCVSGFVQYGRPDSEFSVAWDPNCCSWLVLMVSPAL